MFPRLVAAIHASVTDSRSSAPIGDTDLPKRGSVSLIKVGLFWSLRLGGFVSHAASGNLFWHLDEPLSLPTILSRLDPDPLSFTLPFLGGLFSVSSFASVTLAALFHLDKQDSELWLCDHVKHPIGGHEYADQGHCLVQSRVIEVCRPRWLIRILDFPRHLATGSYVTSPLASLDRFRNPFDFRVDGLRL